MSGLRLAVGDRAIEIGFRSPTLGKELDVAGKLALARELGLYLIEPQCAAHELDDLASATQLGEAARAASVAIRSCGCALPLSDETADLPTRCEFAIATCRALGCDYIFTVVKNPPDPDEAQARTWQRVVERLRTAVGILGAAGIRLAIEPDHGSFVHTAERLEHLLDAVGDERLLVNFDACNLYLGGSDPLRALRRFASRIRSGHIKDGRYRCGRWQECAIGDGEVPWAAILPAMAQAGIACPMHIEHCTTAAAVRAATAHLRGLIAS